MKLRSPISLYDAQGLAFGILMASLGVVLLKACGLITGQTAGASVLLSYLLPVDFGVIFLVVSLPFLWLSWKRRGKVFTLRTLVAVVGISVTTPLLESWISFERLPPLLAAILAGATAGAGLIALFRHNASAGGLGVLALIVEERTGFRTGWFQMCFDAVVFGVALFVLPLDLILYSALGAAVLNAVIAWNFRIHQSGASPDQAAPKPKA
ncbi:YitT family protein [Salipiger sp. PrR002]|uniref:YitT family protein n=1 Tax=Salipiger sp. PrR002 TaxID=2706489 RepID=UPI0013B8C3D6|nr:YitT family protein [Salipiger sp. PrR002]NDV99941.1 YitT family protein [Salipiger sp. PrR002]NDW56266.1 YitT family protein [Salipiger sp. PrR004]